MDLKYFRLWRFVFDLAPSIGQPWARCLTGCGLSADDWIAEQVFWRFYWIIEFKPRCQWPECTERAMACYSSNGWLAEPRAVGEWLCPYHAGESGYCEMCGLFSADTEGFDWINPANLWAGDKNRCDTCRDSVAHDEYGPGEEDPADPDYPFLAYDGQPELP